MHVQRVQSILIGNLRAAIVDTSFIFLIGNYLDFKNMTSAV